MDSREIQKFLKTINSSMKLNVFAANRIPVHVTLPFYCVSNLDPDTKPGSHWVAICIDKHGDGEYFDSFGRKPTGYHELFLITNCRKWNYNNKVIQNYISSNCGIYCLVFIYLRYSGVCMFNFTNMFTTNTVINDKIVNNLFKYFFQNKM